MDDPHALYSVCGLYPFAQPNAAIGVLDTVESNQILNVAVEMTPCKWRPTIDPEQLHALLMRNVTINLVVIIAVKPHGA